ncbi:hypothetical protein, partial [Mycobacterium asiaticum]|uniref:hypothetical protein n=1 Tax=Mycobacterium asiaticum TaxID=1790 RepID=UPI000A55BA31
MPSLEFFLLTARLNAVVVDYLDAGDDPDIQPISATIELRPRIPTGKLVWGPTLSPPQGIALPSIKARFDTAGVEVVDDDSVQPRGQQEELEARHW